MAGSIINTGINLVATNVSSTIRQVRRFGSTISQVGREVDQFANAYQRTEQRVRRASNSLSTTLNRNWRNEYNAIRRNPQALQQLESQYDRTFRNIGNKYQSMVMGSVALSMSGIGIKNVGMNLLGALKKPLDQAKDFETVMKQIDFYSKDTWKKMGVNATAELKKVQSQIIKMGVDLPVKTSEVGNAVLGAVKTGYNSNDALKMGKESSKIMFMSQGKLSGDESLKYLNMLSKTMGIGVDKVSTISDKIAKTADISSASVDSLWKTIQSSRTAYNALGTDPNSFMALTGVMSDRLTPRNAGMALNSFAGGTLMAERAGRTAPNSKRGKQYNELTKAMGGNLDSYKGDILKFIDDVAQKSKEIWGTGSARKGNLASIFGKSAVDLFYAVDAYGKKAGKSMVQMRSEIEKSDGSSKKLIDTLMNSSYGTEETLKGLIEQFQILFGTAIRPMFNTILRGLSSVLKGINRFIALHPKLAKVLGYGAGLAGLFLTVTGSLMLFAGGILAIYASLNNMVIQLARNTRAVQLLSRGYSTAGQMIRAQFLTPLKLMGKYLFRMSAITFFLYLAWKNDFLRMKTKFLEWKNAIGLGLTDSQAMMKSYANGSREALNSAFQANKSKGDLEGWVANVLTKAQMAYDGVKKIWKNGILPVDTYNKLKDAGLLGFVEDVYKVKTAIVDFWHGFLPGLKDGLQFFLTITKPIRVIFNWLLDKTLKILKHFGFFQSTGTGISNKWGEIGQKAGLLLGIVLSIRFGLFAWAKAIKLVVSPFKLIYKTISGTWRFFKLLKGFKFNPGGIIGRILVPRTVRNTIGGVRQRVWNRTMQGAHSELPNARRGIDSTTGRPNGTATLDRPRTWQERRQLRRQQRQQRTTVPGRNGGQGTYQGRGLRGRVTDLWHGREIVPEQRVDSRGRTYHQIRRPGGGITRTTVDGRVNGRGVRTGGLRGFFQNASSYIRNERGAVGRARNPVVRVARAGGGRGISGVLRGGASLLGRGGGGLLRGLGTAFRTIGPKLAGGLGKGLLRGLGFVLKRGLPLIFKIGLRAIPFLGEALMAWDLIKLVWSNWGWFEKAGKWAWGLIAKFGNWVWGGIKAVGASIWDYWKSIGISWWNQIKTIAGIAWNGIKTLGYNVIHTYVTYFHDVWNLFKSIATGKWDQVGGYARKIWSDLKSNIGNIFSGLLSTFTGIWNSVVGYAKNNPITQTITKVTKTVQSIGKSNWNPLNWFGHRTGLWSVPKDNYPAMLHQGEMVLTRRESQIMRNMVGSDNNSIAQTLLGKAKTSDISSSAIPQKRTMQAISKPQVTIQTVAQGKTQDKQTNGDIKFEKGSIIIQVANASKAEMVRGAKQMFNDFKRMVELDNVKNYKPARPRRG